MRTTTARCAASKGRDTPARAQESESGFSLLELTVALAVSTTLLVLILQMLELNSRVGRVQIDLAEVQQSQRVVHRVLADAVRMSGRGGIPIAQAINVLDNVDGSTFTVATNTVTDGSDVLQVRGVFENILLIDAQGGYTFDPATNTGTILVKEKVPSLAGPNEDVIRTQDLSYFEEAITDDRPVALVIVSARNINTIAVVQMMSSSSIGVDGDGVQTATLNFSSEDSEGIHNAAYLDLSTTGAWPGNDRLSNASMVGILDEYWYYVRETDTAVEGNHPRLSRAKFLPNTAVLDGNAAEGRVDIADNVIDLQLERAFDLDGDLLLDEDFDNRDLDEWLGNHVDDDFADVKWADLSVMTHVAVNTMTRSQRTHSSFMSDALDAFANHKYDEDDVPTDQDEIIDRRHRRRVQRTVVELRNL